MGSMEHRLLYMDGLRAVAVLSVVIYHAYWRAGPALAGWETKLFSVGAHGVDLFFVISGFCLAYPYLSRLRAGQGLCFSPHEFAAKRILRIVPPYYAALAILSALGAAGKLPGVPLPDLLRQALFIDWKTKLLDISFWTLPIEWRWYLWFLPALALYARKPVLLGLAAMGSYLAFCSLRFDVPDLETAVVFCMGIYAADLCALHSPLRRFAGAIFLPAFAIGIYELPSTIGNYTSLPLQIAAFAFIVSSSWYEPLRMLLSRPALTWIGERSYSIYLMHDPVIRMLEYRHDVPWPLAAIAGVGSGIALWALVERVTTEKNVRERFTRWYVERLARMVYDPYHVRHPRARSRSGLR